MGISYSPMLRPLPNFRTGVVHNALGTNVKNLVDSAS